MMFKNKHLLYYMLQYAYWMHLSEEGVCSSSEQQHPGECLTALFSMSKKLWSVESAYVHGVNTPSVADINYQYKGTQWWVVKKST